MTTITRQTFELRLTETGATKARLDAEVEDREDGPTIVDFDSLSPIEMGRMLMQAGRAQWVQSDGTPVDPSLLPQIKECMDRNLSSYILSF